MILANSGLPHRWVIPMMFCFCYGALPLPSVMAESLTVGHPEPYNFFARSCDIVPLWK